MDSLRYICSSTKSTNIRSIGGPEEVKKKEYKNFGRDYTKKKKNLQYGKRNSQSSPSSSESPIQDKSEEKCMKTHTNQTNKD